MSSLNDLVTAWAANNADEATYNAGKAGLQAMYTFDQIMAAGDGDWNSGMMSLADIPGALTQDAVLWLDARYSVSGEPRVINQGTGGASLDAKYGSVLGAYVYDGAAVLPGSASNNLSVPDEAALDITGDLEMVGRVSMADWTSSAYLFGKWGAAAGTKSYVLVMESSGAPRLYWYEGASLRSSLSTISFPFVDGEAYWVKVTLDVDDGAGGRATRFYHAPDQPDEPSSWTLMSTITFPATTSVLAATEPFRIGASDGGSFGFWPGSVYRTIVRNGIGGTTVLDVDLADVSNYSTSFTATTGQTVTVNSTSSDTNDPLLLTHTGENYVYLPGIASNTLSVPDAAALDITGDFEIVLRVATSDWTPSSSAVIASRTTLVDPNRAWYVQLNTNGTLNFTWWPTGSAASQISKNSTIAPTVADGSAIWVKATLDVDNGAAGNTVRFHTAPDQAIEPSSWTQLGNDVVTAGTTSLPNVTAPLYLGAHGPTSGPFTGSVYRAILRNGIDGTTVFDFDATTDITDAGATSFTATSGQTVTVNRSTSGRKTALVTRPIWLFGTDDYLEVADNALLDFGAGEDFSLVAVYRQWATSVTNAPIIQKDASPNAGYGLVNGTGTGRLLLVNDGVNSANDASTSSNGPLVTMVGVVDRTAQEAEVWENTTPSGSPSSTTAVGALATTAVLRVGGNSIYNDMECVAVAVWRRVLTTDEIAAINTYYGTA